MKKVLHETRSSWLLLLQVERTRLYEAELNVFLIRRTNAIFVWRKQFFCQYSPLSDVLFWLQVYFFPKEKWLSCTHNSSRIFVSKTNIQRFSIFCGPKNCSRSTEFCLGSANDLGWCNAIWRFWASLIVNNLFLCSKYHSKLNPSDNRIFSVSDPQILVLFS